MWIVLMIALFYAARRFKKMARARQVALGGPFDWVSVGPNVSVARNMPVVRIRWKGQVDTSAYSTQEDAWQAASMMNWMLSLKLAEKETMERIIGTAWRGN